MGEIEIPSESFEIQISKMRSYFAFVSDPLATFPCFIPSHESRGEAQCDLQSDCGKAKLCTIGKPSAISDAARMLP